MTNYKTLNNNEASIFAKLLLTFSNVDFADQFLTETFKGQLDYSTKFEILQKYFLFTMIGGYDPTEHTEADKMKANYLHTLQHLLNKSKVVGIEAVIKPEFINS